MPADFGIADGTTLVVDSVSPNRTNKTVEAANEDGDVIACEVMEARESPTVAYSLKASLSGNGAKNIVLGGVTTVTLGGTSKYFCLTSVTLGTSAGNTPTVSASGEQVCSATPNSTYTLTKALEILAKAKAQILAEAFTLAGTKCHVNSCSAAFEVKFVPVENNGTLIAWDVTDGRITVTVNVTQGGSDEPTLTAASGWTMTAVPDDPHADSSYKSWTCTFTKFLAKDQPSS